MTSAGIKSLPPGLQEKAGEDQRSWSETKRGGLGVFPLSFPFVPLELFSYAASTYVMGNDKTNLTKPLVHLGGRSTTSLLLTMDGSQLTEYNCSPTLPGGSSEGKLRDVHREFHWA